ncbi:DUF551 domain-containing protein [Moraxella lacunata]|uniref:DUF551 domain-containing protein n=1 Tax=Moraxella lacunata TaxID=477 RepID=A0A1V4GX92_MORLA|nr:DUF551 domain-containing protein [Moraxella lacunata]OPH36756.1 hypothetical protein B5J94_06840 [Moraxella lacunata]
MNKPKYFSITYDMSKLSDDEQKAVIAEASSLFARQKAVCAGWESFVDNGWISVDNTPPEDIELLLYHPEMNKTVKGYYAVDNTPITDDDGKEYAYSHWFDDEYGSFAWEFDEISHWQPLPQPPKE